MAHDLGTDTNPSSEWHSIRPWTPQLSLAVREITSVSATFILSSSFSETSSESEPLLASLGLTIEDDNEEGPEELSISSESKKRTVIADALAKGLSVNVNGTPWQRVLIRIDDASDEAVIILYGLMPGRQYDIDLSLVQAGHSSNIRKQVTTEDIDISITESCDSSESSSLDQRHSEPPSSTPSTSPSRTVPNTPPMGSNTHVAQGSSPLTVEDRLNQLQHTLSLLISERESLTASLKTARRDAQKADAAVRSEIDVLKRASEKHVAAEHRARQKVLALQEAVKRAHSATREMENSVKVIEKSLPGLKAKRAEKEEEYTKVKEDADRGRKEMEKEAEKDRKKVENMKGELSTLGNKMEKLTGKREKLETVVIPDLEEQLREIEREIEKAESEPHVVYEFPSSSDDGFYDEGDQNGGTDRQSYLPVQRTRHSSATSSHPSTAGAIGRPPPPPQNLVTPIQRPSYTPLWAPAPAPTSRNRTQSSQLSPVTSMRNATASHPSGNSNSNSNSTSSSSSPTPAAAQSSTLSSRAPAFEPGRIPLALRSSPSHSSTLASSSRSRSGSSSGMGPAPGSGSGYTPSPPITIQRQNHHTNPSPSHYGNNIWGGFEGRANGAG